VTRKQKPWRFILIRTYQNRYSWSHTKNINDIGVLFHKDSSVSVAFSWSGIDTALRTNESILSAFRDINDALQSLLSDSNIVIENHFLRDYSDTVCREYIEYGEKNTVRAHEFSALVRQEMAETISNHAMSTKIITVITIERRLKPIDSIFPKRALKKSNIDAKKLLKIADAYLYQFANAKYLSADEIEYEIWYNYHKDRARTDSIPSPNDRYFLSDRVAQKPRYENDLIRVGDTYTRVIMLIDYPDAGLDWFSVLSNHAGIEIDVTQVIKPVSVARAMLSSASQTKRSAESAMAIGGESVQGKVQEHNQYRQFVNDNNLSVFDNAYIIKIHHPSPEFVEETTRDLIKSLGPETVVAPFSEEIAMAFWRVSQIGQGHLTPFTRQDHTLQVANMMPIIKQNDGDPADRQMLRLTSGAQAITLAYARNSTNHAITAAKTGSGKGVEQVTQICELYPLGINFYGAEVGASYKWVTEAFGGDYYHLDANTVISPFPDFSLANPKNESPLDDDIIRPTIGALLPLMARGKKDISHHVESVAEQIMQDMYREITNSDRSAPTLYEFNEYSKSKLSSFSGIHKEAVGVMHDNLSSFLNSSGKQFKNSDSLDFSKGIVFVDFKKLMNNEELAKFMLVFISLRYKQLAFANNTPTRIVLDELHEFARIDKELTATLMKQLTRMGRKEAGFFHGISQETLDMALEEGILNQISHRYFMYLQSGHEKTAEIFKMNDKILSCWQGYKNPDKLKYRQCIRQDGDNAYDLHLVFPKTLLDLAHTGADALTLKEEIGKRISDPIERLTELRKLLG
jgi:hypothetical protein